jgi:hypothetical protein
MATVFWSKGSGKRLRGHKEAQIVFWYLLSGPHSSMTGIYSLNLATIMAETGLSKSDVAKGLRECAKEKMAFYDEEEELVWVPALSHHQVGLRIGIGKSGEPDKRIRGLLRDLKPFVGHRFVAEYVRRYAECYSFGHPKIAPLVARAIGEAPLQTSQTDQTSVSSRSLPTYRKSSESNNSEKSRRGYASDPDPDPDPGSVPKSRSKTEEVDPTRSVREVSQKRTRSKPNPDVAKVFDAWKQDTGHHRAKLDQKRTSRIKARLREGFTAEELIQAIAHRRNDPFLMGENDTGRVYDGIQTLLRDSEQVERLLGLTRPQRERDRPPEDPEWEARRARVLAATERKLEAERRGEKPQRRAQDAAETRHGARDDPSPAPGPKNARAPDSEQLAKVIELSERIGS